MPIELTKNNYEVKYMINNYLCMKCDKAAVCRIMAMLEKFDEDNKKSLGVDITMVRCLNYEEEPGHEE